MELYNINKKENINILDVCMGTGYNSACIFDNLISTSKAINWCGLEIDKRPLKIAVEDKRFRKMWSLKVLSWLDLLNRDGRLQTDTIKGEIIWGDARQAINNINESICFDLILLDPFSPTKCPQLWSEEFLNSLVSKMAYNGKLITYSRAAAIRGSLIRAGLKIFSIPPKDKTQEDWSDGTIGILLNKEYERGISNNCFFQNLTRMEEEHLLTKAAIPYRDPSGEGNSEEILRHRQIEQKDSQLEKTKNWKKRWSVCN